MLRDNHWPKMARSVSVLDRKCQLSWPVGLPLISLSQHKQKLWIKTWSAQRMFLVSHKWKQYDLSPESISVLRARVKSCCTESRDNQHFPRQYENMKATLMSQSTYNAFNPLDPELNPICYLLALLGVRHFLHVSRIRVKSLTLRLLM